MFELSFNYTFQFNEGAIKVEGASSLVDAEECARVRALKLGWKNNIISYKCERA